MTVLAWALLQPPALPNGGGNARAPLGDWQVNGQFANEEECERTRRANLAALAYGLQNDGGGGPGTEIITQARCISVEELKKLLGSKPDRGPDP